jgi:hypothetical protein
MWLTSGKKKSSVSILEPIKLDFFKRDNSISRINSYNHINNKQIRSNSLNISRSLNTSGYSNSSFCMDTSNSKIKTKMEKLK